MSTNAMQKTKMSAPSVLRNYISNGNGKCFSV